MQEGVVLSTHGDNAPRISVQQHVLCKVGSNMEKKGRTLQPHWQQPQQPQKGDHVAFGMLSVASKHDRT